jgi:hypothetical protein
MIITEDLIALAAAQGACADALLFMSRQPRQLSDLREDWRAWAAQQQRCPTAMLLALAADSSDYVRGGVARNTAAPVEALEALAKDASPQIANLARLKLEARRKTP